MGGFEIVEKEMSKNSEIYELKSECIRKMSEISWEKSEHFLEISESSSHSFVGERQEELLGEGEIATSVSR
ncbi:hypothetical protein HMPREF9999_01359 [Alloprevotella sp. oral taxon 473 str. F0040]|nr:hypothetical protein HMPREF9999_01359 [Alloprevotella sp. oral taxon 473 str. F0040]